jgi:hypothetical protein
MNPAVGLIYLLMVDRFADGLPDAPGTVDATDPQGWHGGDIPGIRARLDHLEGLGVDTLWLTPLATTRTEKMDQWGAYHGYWTLDHRTLEPRFGTRQDLIELVADLHKRDMKLLLDVVVNHLGYESPRLATHPHWFHAPTEVKDWNDPNQRINGWIHGLPDLAVEREEVSRYLVDAAIDWLSWSGADGLRIDAMRHVPLPFISAFAQVVNTGSQQPKFLLGEHLIGDPYQLAADHKASSLHAAFDFPLAWALRDLTCRDGSLGQLATVLSADRAHSDAGTLVTLLDNHDMPRISSACEGDHARVDRALALLFALRGIPSITWGTEIYMEGAEEPLNRASMPWAELDGAQAPIAELAANRRAHPSLRAGETHLLGYEEGELHLLRWHAEEVAELRIGPGGAFTVEFYAPEGPPPPRGSRTVRFEVRARDARGLHVVGSDPELGSWDPAKGLRLSRRGRGMWVAQVTLPDRHVLSWKVVQILPGSDPNGAAPILWEDRGDRVGWIGPGEGPLELTARWLR